MQVKQPSPIMSSLIHNFAMNRDPKIYQYIKQFTKSHTLPLQLHLGANVANTDYNKAELFTNSTFKYLILMGVAHQPTH